MCKKCRCPTAYDIPKVELLWRRVCLSLTEFCQILSGCPILHSHKQWMRILIFSHFLKHLVLSAFTVLTVRGVKRHHFTALGLHLPGYGWGWAYFHVVFSHLYFLFRWVPSHIFAHFSIVNVHIWGVTNVHICNGASLYSMFTFVLILGKTPLNLFYAPNSQPSP